MKQLCKDCKAADWCRHAFGKYYADKSHGGEGCEHPLPQDERTVRAAMKVVRLDPRWLDPKDNPF